MAVRIYELNSGPKGPSCQTKHYGRWGKQWWQVAAVSVRQAIYLAVNDVWREDGEGTGIVAYTSNLAERPVLHDEGTTDWVLRYKHYQTKT